MLLLPITVYADGDPNIDNGGGETEDGTKENSWNIGNDGVRVTIVRESDKRAATSPVDFSNSTRVVNFNFGYKNKLNYKNGSSLNPNNDAYQCVKPATAIPAVVTANGGANIVAIKTYFSKEGTLKDICDKTGFDYDELISGDYVVMLEPLVYITYNGIKFCMTATEAALYDRMTSGDLKSKLGNITHQNLPLAMFLEKPDLGFPAWKGSTSGIRSNEDIISSLGIGTVRFTEQPEEPKDEDDTPPAGTKVYEYHTNTDVITAIDVKDTKGGKSGISPDDKAKVTFRVNGNTYTKSFVTPPHESTPLWIKWRTPSTPQKVTINVSSTHGQVITPTVIANVTELTESTPPDPESRDTNKGFRVPKVPKQMNVTRLTWGEWLPKWHENWEWESDWQWKKKGHNSNCKPDCTKNHGGKWVDKGKYVDNGWWVYTWREYYATASAESTVKPADQVPTAYKSGNTYKMKSGYGINIDVKAKVFTTGKNGDITTAQNAIATFPEFGYSTYNRVLELTGRNEFAFRRNPYSMYKAPVHFLPVWYPDRSDYAPQTVVLDIWTPSGQLMVYSDDKLRIDGSYFDDWHVAPQLVR